MGDKLLGVVNRYNYLPCTKLDYSGRPWLWLPLFIAGVLGLPLAVSQFAPPPPSRSLLLKVFSFLRVILLVLLPLYPLRAKLLCDVLRIFTLNTFLFLPLAGACPISTHPEANTLLFSLRSPAA